MNLSLAGPLTQALGWSLVHLVWQGTMVAALLALLLRICTGRSANFRYAASCAALALIVVLGVLSAVRSYRGATVGLPAAPSALISAAPVQSAAVVRAPQLTRMRALARSANDALPAVVAVWLAGVALFSVRLLLEWLRAQLLLTRHASRAREQWQAITRRLSQGLGVRQAVRVLESTLIEVPSVIGWLKPTILLPASVLSGLTPAQLEMILAHELAHIRRHDFLVNLLQAVVETLLFYHPAVWWISRQVRIERENCCDDLAVSLCGNRLRYAHALLRLEELRATAMPLAMSADGGSLFERIKRLGVGTRLKDGPTLRGTVALAVLSMVLIATAVPLSPALGRSTLVVNQSLTHKLPVPLVTQHLVVSAIPVPIPMPLAVPIEVHTSAQEVATVDGPDAESTDDPSPPEATANTDDQHISIDDLIALRNMGVTPEDIHDIRRMFPHTSLQTIASMKAVGATPEFVMQMRAAGLSVVTADQAQSLAAVGVTTAFLRDMRGAGLVVQSADEAQSLAAVGVTSKYLLAIRSLGIKIQSPADAQSLAAVGVTPEYVRDMRTAGLTLNTVEQARSMCAVGVTPEFVQRLSQAGYRNLSSEQLTRLAAAGVNDDFIREMSQYRK